MQLTTAPQACCDGGLIIFVPPVEGFLNVCVLKKSWLPASSLRGVDMKSGNSRCPVQTCDWNGAQCLTESEVAQR